MGFALVRIAAQDDDTRSLITPEQGTEGQANQDTAEWGIPAEAAPDAPRPGIEPEVEGRDLKYSHARGGWVFHRWLGWGNIYDQFGNYRFLYHYHPYGTAYAIYYE